MAHRSNPSNAHKQPQDHAHSRSHRKDDDQVYLITGASESVVADARRKNRTYAITIGIRILSLFVVLMTDGWVQIAVFLTGMLAPWIGVQIANTIRQVGGRSIEAIPPQQAAIEAAQQEADDADDDTVIVGDVVAEDNDATAPKPSAESGADTRNLRDNEGSNDDTGS